MLFKNGFYYIRNKTMEEGIRTERVASLKNSTKGEILVDLIDRGRAKVEFREFTSLLTYVQAACAEIAPVGDGVDSTINDWQLISFNPKRKTLEVKRIESD